MDWRTALGVSLALVAYFLPYAIKAMQPWLYWPGIVAGLLFFGWSIPGAQRIRIAHGLSLIFIASVIAGGIAWFVSPHRPVDEVLPGFATGLELQIDDVTELRKKYQFDFHTPEGAHTALFLATGNYFTFDVTDVHDQHFLLNIPLGFGGIPFKKFLYIFCEAGTATEYSYLRVLVNGKEVARADYDHGLDLGSRQWTPTIGAQESGQNRGALRFTEIGALSTTLSDSQIRRLTDNVLARYKQKN